MTPLTDLWLAILVSSVAVFVVSSVLHMLLPIHKGDMRPLPDEDLYPNLFRKLRDQRVRSYLNAAYAEGNIEVTEGALQSARGEQLYLVTLGPGSFAGEVGVLGDSPEAYGAVAREPSIVLEAPKLAVLRLMEQAPSFAATLDGLYARHGLQHHLKGGGLGRVSDAAIAAGRLHRMPRRCCAARADSSATVTRSW